MLSELHFPSYFTKAASANSDGITRASTLGVDLGHGVTVDTAPVPIGICDAVQNGLTDTEVAARHLTAVDLTSADTQHVIQQINKMPL
jgi:hypothetical protein